MKEHPEQGDTIVATNQDSWQQPIGNVGGKIASVRRRENIKHLKLFARHIKFLTRLQYDFSTTPIYRY